VSGVFFFFFFFCFDASVKLFMEHRPCLVPVPPRHRRSRTAPFAFPRSPLSLLPVHGTRVTPALFPPVLFLILKRDPSSEKPILPPFILRPIPLKLVFAGKTKAFFVR